MEIGQEIFKENGNSSLDVKLPVEKFIEFDINQTKEKERYQIFDKNYLEQKDISPDTKPKQISDFFQPSSELFDIYTFDFFSETLEIEDEVLYKLFSMLCYSCPTISIITTFATSGFKSLLDPSLRKVMLVGFGLAVFVQLSGINTIIDYAPKIFTTAGWRLDTGLFATFGLGIVNFIFTWVSILVIDKFGRRPLYILGSAGLALTLLCLSILDFTGNFKGIAVLIIIMIYLAFFSSCIGPVFWTYMSEIFPNRIRGTALSVPVFTQWIFNALVVLVFPLMLTKLQSSYTFLIIFFLAAGQLLFSWAYMKETKGKSLEEIEDMWKQETRQIT